MILVMYVDNNCIRLNCEELGQEFEKFVVMAMEPGADLDSLPILDNPDNFVVHAYAAFILVLSYVAINNLPQLNSFRCYSTCSSSKQRLFISRMPDFWFHYLLGITDRKSSWCAANRLSLVSASFRNSFKTESSVHSSALQQFRYPTLGPKLCHEYLSNPLQINFLATGTLAANDFHSALPTPVRLLMYSSCFSWSRWCMCFVIRCMVAYTSLSSF